MTNTKSISIILAVIVIGGGTIGIVLFWMLGGRELLNSQQKWAFAFAIGLSVFVSLLLSALPLLISYVQTTAKERQINKLKYLSGSRVAETEYCKLAIRTLESIKPPTILDPDYRTPIISFTVVVVFGCLMVLLGGSPETKSLFERTTFLLGGMEVMEHTAKEQVVNYQMGTLLVGSIAFIGSYIYMLTRLVDRINNNDIYPISYYYYIVHFVVGVLVAMVLRHVLSLFDLIPKDSTAILLIAFAIGFKPDLFIVAMLRRAFKMMCILGDQGDPDQSVLPTNMNLLMIEGLTSDKIDHLAELDIDNAQILANQNPFIIWPRLPYSLTLIVNWIAQAQLYCFSKETGVKALRAKSINTIFDLHAALSDAASATEIAAVAGLCSTSVKALVSSLEADPPFHHLKEVRDAL